MSLAKAARVFNIPITIADEETGWSSGHTFLEMLGAFPGKEIPERNSMSASDDQKARDASERNGNDELIVSICCS